MGEGEEAMLSSRIDHYDLNIGSEKELEEKESKEKFDEMKKKLCIQKRKT